jgi:hypothetical protein
MAHNEFVLDQGQDRTENRPHKHDEKPQRPQQQEKGEAFAPYGGIAWHACYLTYQGVKVQLDLF